MGYNFPPRAKERLLQGVQFINGEPHMQENGETRYVRGKPYFNTLTYEIEIR